MDKTLDTIIYTLLVISLILILYYIFVKLRVELNEPFNQINKTSKWKWNKGCFGSYWYPFKCPPHRPYEWSASNWGTGVCCQSFPHENRGDIYNCVRGVYRPRKCSQNSTGGCRDGEIETGEIPNDLPGVCCSKIPVENPTDFCRQKYPSYQKHQAIQYKWQHGICNRILKSGGWHDLPYDKKFTCCGKKT